MNKPKFFASLLVLSFLLTSPSAEFLLAQVSPVNGNSTYSTINGQNQNFNINAQVRSGAAPNNDVTTVGPIRSQTVGQWTFVESPALNANGQKPEGTWNVVFRRTTINNFGQNVNEAASATIRYDRTRPRCPIVNTGAGINEWPTGLNGVWASDSIEFYADDRYNYTTNTLKDGFGVCRDQITIQGNVQDRNAAGCQANNTKQRVTKCGDRLTFPMYDRVGNGPRNCTTPPALIDRGAPRINGVMQIEHRGLRMPPESKGTAGNPRRFKADDGALFLLIDVEDRPGGSNSCESGLNWNQVVESEEISQKRSQLLQLMQRRDQLQENLDQQLAQEVLDIGNRLANYYVKANMTLNLNLWKKVSENITAPSSYIIQDLDDLETRAANLASRNISRNTFNDVVSEINDSKFDSVGGIGSIRSQLGAFDMNFIETRKNTAMAETNSLLGVFDFPNLPPQDSTTTDDNTLRNYSDEWNARKVEDYSFYIPNWEESVDEMDTIINDRYNDFYVPYKTALLDPSLRNNIDDLELGFTVTTDIADLIHDLSPTAVGSHESHINTAVTRINQFNSRVSQTLSDLQGYSIIDPPPLGTPPVDPPPYLDPFFDYGEINGLISRATQMSQAIATVDGDTDPAGVFGEAVAVYDDYATNDIDSRTSRRETIIADSLAQDASYNTAIQDNRATQFHINTQLTDVNSQISTLQDEIAALEAAALNNADLEDLGISHVEIERLGGGPVQSYIDSTMAPVGGDSFEWNVNQYKFDGEDHSIFSQVGNYKITVRIYDNAYNRINPIQTAYIRIYPAEADKTQTESSLNHNCTNGDLYANLADACQVSFITQDRFENVIAQNSSMTAFAQTQDTEGSYDVVTEMGNNYLNGVRLQGGSKEDGKHKLNWSSPASGARVINVREILPTVNVIEGINGAALMSPITKTLPLQLSSPMVSNRGVVQGTRQSFTMDVPILFNPWVSLFLSDRPNNQPPSTPWEVGVDTEECLYAYTTTTNSGKDLPVNYDVNIKAHIDENVETYNEDLATPVDGRNVPFTGISDWNSEKLVCTHIRPTGGQANLAAGFTSKIKYRLDGEDLVYAGNNLGLMAGDICIFPELCPACAVPGSCPTGCVGGGCSPSCPPGETCTEADPCDLFPSLCTPEPPRPCEILGTCPSPPIPPCQGMTPEECLCDVVAPGSCVEFDYVTAGADIEGGVLVEDEDFIYISSDDTDLGDQAQFLGGNTQIDIREEATRNAFELTRGLAPQENSSILDLDLSNLQDGGVTYVRGGIVRIGNGATEVVPEIINGGKHTIIVEDGNVLIAGDTRYQGLDDILGIMIINTDPSAPSAGTYNSTGNIFVHKDVKFFSAVVFADGSLTTTESRNNPQFSENFDRDSINGNLNNQLIQTGALLTRNTLGGAQLLPDAQDPWGRSVSIPVAQKYDLHHIRRYSPIFNGGGTHLNAARCTDLEGSCYPNKHSFVMRIDQRISYDPPPGFETSGNASFQ